MYLPTSGNDDKTEFKLDRRRRIERFIIKELLACLAVHKVLPVTVGSVMGKY